MISSYRKEKPMKSLLLPEGKRRLLISLLLLLARKKTTFEFELCDFEFELPQI